MIYGFRFSSGLPIFLAFGAALFFTYQTLRILEYIPPVLHKQPPRQRIDAVLENLSDAELAALRQRLMDQDSDYDYESLDSLLKDVAPKRKLHNS
jgi:hypothetical protein